jgi:cyclohexyl-isocyanide hydratase
MNLDAPLDIGALIFPRIDQMDFTGPFEVLSRLPNSTFHSLWKDLSPVRDVNGLLLTPEMKFSEAPGLDVLIVPGGFGQQALMDDETVLSFIRAQAANARHVMSVCTGALICGAAGLLRGRRATTHWTAFHLLEYFGAIPVNERVVIDGNYLSTAGVSAGIDGALRMAALLRGERVAQFIQLSMEYAPEPPFAAGSVKTAPRELVARAREYGRTLAEARLETARRIGEKLGTIA